MVERNCAYAARGTEPPSAGGKFTGLPEEWCRFLGLRIFGGSLIRVGSSDHQALAHYFAMDARTRRCGSVSKDLSAFAVSVEWSEMRRGQAPSEDPERHTRLIGASSGKSTGRARLALAPQNVARALATLSRRARRSGRASVCSVARVIQPFDLQIAISRASPSAGPAVSHAAASLDPWILRVSRASSDLISEASTRCCERHR